MRTAALRLKLSEMGELRIDPVRHPAQVKARVREVLATAKPSLDLGDWIFVLCMLALCIFVFFLPVAIFLIARRVIRKRRAYRDLAGDSAAFIDRAALTVAYPLMVNTMLLKPGKQTAPGLFLVSPDPLTGSDARFNVDLAETISLPESPPMSEADEAWCIQLFVDETFTPLRLRKVPATISGGRAVYAADLAVDGRLLHGRTLSEGDGLLPCLFDETSRMCLILPAWAFGDVPPTAAEREVLLEALLLQQHLKRRATAT